jgi:hypothetical protein
MPTIRAVLLSADGVGVVELLDATPGKGTYFYPFFGHLGIRLF